MLVWVDLVAGLSLSSRARSGSSADSQVGVTASTIGREGNERNETKGQVRAVRFTAVSPCTCSRPGSALQASNNCGSEEWAFSTKSSAD